MSFDELDQALQMTEAELADTAQELDLVSKKDEMKRFKSPNKKKLFKICFSDRVLIELAF